MSRRSLIAIAIALALLAVGVVGAANALSAGPSKLTVTAPAKVKPAAVVSIKVYYRAATTVSAAAQRRIGSRWVTEATKTVRRGTKSFSLRWRSPRREGRYTVRVTLKKGARALATSRSFTVTVKATNHPPTFPLRVVVSGVVNTNSYDALGGLVGVTTSMTIDTPATDLDGDPLSYRWTASNGSIAGAGLSAMWTRVLERNPELPVPGRPYPLLVAAPGTVTVTVTDGRGGTATHDLVFE